jgi:hypothetical protein
MRTAKNAENLQVDDTTITAVPRVNLKAESLIQPLSWVVPDYAKTEHCISFLSGYVFTIAEKLRSDTFAPGPR